MSTKIFVCLANSRKLSGRCIAGREVVEGGYGGWIRPVSARASGEVSEEERRYENGSDPRVLDIIEVPLLSPAPHSHQTENWVLDKRRYWGKRGRLAGESLAALVEKPAALWTIDDSSANGVNHRVRLEVAAEQKGSLVLIEPEYLQIHVGAHGLSKRRVKASFLYNNTPYALVVTDPVVERAFLAKADGAYALEKVFLCVSLTESWEGWCYKVVAAVIEGRYDN